MSGPSLYLGKEIRELPNISFSQNNDYYVFQRVNEIGDGMTFKISRLNLFKDFVFNDFSKYDPIDKLLDTDVFFFNRNFSPFKTTAKDVQNFVLDLSQPYIFEKSSIDDEDWLFVYDSNRTGEKKCKITFKNLVSDAQTALKNAKIKINVVGGVTGTTGGAFIEMSGIKVLNINTTVLASSHHHDGRYAQVSHQHSIFDITDYIKPNLVAGKGIKIEGNSTDQEWKISEIDSVSDITILGGYGMRVVKVGTVWTLAIDTSAINIEAGFGVGITRTGEAWTITNTDPGSGINIVAGPNIRIDRLSSTDWRIVSLLHPQT